jgi:signal transduction histidine kinase
VAEWPEVAQALKGEPASTMRRREPPIPPVKDFTLARDEGLRVFVAFPVLQDDHVIGTVLVSRTPRTLLQAMWGKRYALIGIGTLLLGAIAILAWAATRLIARPMLHVVQQAQRVARGESETVEPPKNPGTREMADLVEAITRMARTQADRAFYLRSFAASVSHEFKTPLAAMGGAAELLADHEATMSPAERAHFSATIIKGVERLNLLVRRLLELARADLTAGHGDTEVMAAVRRAIEKISGVKIALADAPAVHAAVRPDALDLTLSGLLDNVRVHAGKEATATVVVAADDTAVTITVADDGPGISPENATRIFETFFTTARDRGGTGLGLAIVAALARGANGTVALVPAREGAVFRLTLPRAQC